MIYNDAYQEVTKITNEIRFNVCSYMASRGYFTVITKRNAQELIKSGYNNIWLQCQANGNIQFAKEVAAEVKVHYDLENEQKDDNNDTDQD